MVEKQEKKNKKIKYKRYIFLLFALFAAFFIAEDIFENEMMKIDIISYSIVIKRLRYDILTNIMTFITNFGGVWLLPIITILTIIFVRNKKIGITIFFNLLFILSPKIVYTYYYNFFVELSQDKI